MKNWMQTHRNHINQLQFIYGLHVNYPVIWNIHIVNNQEKIKGTEIASPYPSYSIGNSSRVIFRIGIKLPRALRGCFVEVSHDQTPCKTCRSKGNESVKRSRAFLNIEAKWVGAHLGLGKGNRWTLWQHMKSV